MDITQRTAKLFPLETTGEPYQTHTLEKIRVVRELVAEFERLRVERIELFKEISNAAEEIEKLRKENQTFKEAIITLLLKDVEHVKLWPALKEKE